MIHGVRHSEVLAVWLEIEHLVAKSCAKGGDKYFASDILASLINRDMQLWIADAADAFAITSLVKYPQKTILRIEIGGGKKYEQHFEEFLSTIEAWGKSNGCHGAEAVTREGYSSLFRVNGWRRTQVYMEKEF